MLCKFCLVLVCLFALATEVYNKPTTRVKSGVQGCFNHVCPENTFACEKVAHISEDKKQVVGVVRCLGLRDNIIKNITTYEPNPFSPDVQYNHYSYSSTYEITVDSGSNEKAEATTKRVWDSDKKTDNEIDNDDVEVF